PPPGRHRPRTAGAASRAPPPPPPPVRPSPLPRLHEILRVRPHPEVGRVAAGRVVAPMAQHLPGRDGTARGGLPRDDVRARDDPADPHHAVPVPVVGPEPGPAARGPAGAVEPGPERLARHGRSTSPPGTP